MGSCHLSVILLQIYFVSVVVVALLPFCPFALLSFCPFALLPSHPCPCPRHGSFVHLSFGGYQEKILFVFVSHFGSCADIVDSPDVTLACTDDNYDLLLSETNNVFA